MQIRVLTLSGTTFDVLIATKRTYDSIITEISDRLCQPATNLVLYHNGQCLGQSTVFDPDSGPPDLNVTVINSTEFPLLSFPPGERILTFDFGLFTPISGKTRYQPDVRGPSNQPRTLREVIRNVGFEFGDPYSMEWTVRLPARADRAFESRVMSQELSGEFADADAERERRAEDGLIPQCEGDLTRRQRAAVDRFSQMGIDRELVLHVFLSQNCDEASTFKKLDHLRQYL
jgi:hypothetical protein